MEAVVEAGTDRAQCDRRNPERPGCRMPAPGQAPFLQRGELIGTCNCNDPSVDQPRASGQPRPRIDDLMEDDVAHECEQPEQSPNERVERQEAQESAALPDVAIRSRIEDADARQ